MLLQALLDLGAGHVQSKIANLRLEHPCPQVAGGVGKINPPPLWDTRALTFKILAPDRGPQEWAYIDFIGTQSYNFCH